MLEDYKIYFYTQKELNRLYSKELLSKYYKELAYLFQNGFRANVKTCEEFEEQLKMFNYFEDDLKEIREISKYESTYEIGKQIVVEELYDIVRCSTFCRVDAENPAIVKTYANTYWEQIKSIIDRLEILFTSKDSEVNGFLSKLINYNDILKKINNISEKIDKDIKVATWFIFVEIINIIYSTYIQYGKVKTETNKLSITSNLNSEIYGFFGGYNPNSKEVKSDTGGAVYDVETCYKTKDVSKLKMYAGIILKENKDVDTEPETFNFLVRWYKGKDSDDEKARRIIVCCLLNGILNLLTLKHNLNLIEDDKRNDLKDSAIKQELTSIVKYCGISKDYLL